jgi:hypothetical protein
LLIQVVTNALIKIDKYGVTQMDAIQGRLFDTKADQAIFELKSFVTELGRSSLWHEGTVHNYSKDAKTQRMMRDILKIAQAAAIDAARRMESEIAGSKTKRARQTKAAQKPARKSQRGQRAAAQSPVGNLH